MSSYDFMYYLKRRIVYALLNDLRKRHGRKPKNFCLPGDHIGDEIFINGLYEADILEGLFTKVFKDKLKEFSECSCVDVGANIGNHSVFFSGRFSAVYAFEPNPVFCSVIRASLGLNDIQNVTVSEYGLSDSQAYLTYSFRTDSLGESAFNASPADAGRRVSLRVERGDDVLPTLDAKRIALIKIDVEGHELNVLKGLSATLAHHSPIVLFESHPDQDPLEASNVIAFLKLAGYQCLYSYEEDRPPPGLLARAIQRIRYGYGRIKLTRLERLENQTYLMLVASKEPLPDAPR